ncbi:MAG: N-formylglutamate amidohydrolase [Myxococcota bacterium]|nr:N-formylglutamate amidohydrolase [Myxococcota bacterium]
MVNTTKAFSIQNPLANGKFILTAEHASNYIPIGHQPSETSILRSHWAWDIGIAPLTEQLSKRCQSTAITACFSRLFCDANRHPRHETLIKKAIEGTPLSFNQHISSEERKRRIQEYHVPYHEAISKSVERRKACSAPFLLLSLHSFTPVWNHRVRSMDIGVLFDQHEDLAQQMSSRLQEHFFVRLNEPYSGKNGLIYSADRHGRTHDIPYLELEINQTLLSSDERIELLAQTLVPILQDFSL